MYESKKIKMTPEDEAWALKVKINAGFKCEICGWEGEKLDAHHVIPRTYTDLRHDTRNGVALCSRCHKGGSRSAHGNPFFFLTKFAILFPSRHAFLLSYCVNRLNGIRQSSAQRELPIMKGVKNDRVIKLSKKIR